MSEQTKQLFSFIFSSTQTVQLKIMEACGLEIIGFDVIENQFELLGNNKTDWEKSEKYLRMYDEGEYSKIEKDLKIKLQ